MTQSGIYINIAIFISLSNFSGTEAGAESHTGTPMMARAISSFCVCCPVRTTQFRQLWEISGCGEMHFLLNLKHPIKHFLRAESRFHLWAHHKCGIFWRENVEVRRSFIPTLETEGLMGPPHLQPSPVWRKKKKGSKTTKFSLAEVRLEWRNHKIKWKIVMKIPMLIQTHIWIQEFSSHYADVCAKTWGQMHENILLMNISK